MHIDTAIPCIVILIVIDVHTDQGMRVTGRSCHELNKKQTCGRNKSLQILENKANWKLCNVCGVAYRYGVYGGCCDSSCYKIKNKYRKREELPRN